MIRRHALRLVRVACIGVSTAHRSRPMLSVCHAGLYFAGERVELPDLLVDDPQPGDPEPGAAAAPAPPSASGAGTLPGTSAAGAAEDAAGAGAATSGGTAQAPGDYGASVPRVSLSGALRHVEDGSGVLLAIDERGTECAPTPLSPACAVSLRCVAAAPLCLLAPVRRKPRHCGVV